MHEKDLEGILKDENKPEKNSNLLQKIKDENNQGEKLGLLQRIKRLYHEKIDSMRSYIVALSAFSIGVANWSKDFAANKMVTLPLVFTSAYIPGSTWYNLALTQEAVTMGALVMTAKERAKMLKYAIAYEAGSAINAFLYYSTFQGASSLYGIEWNNILFFFQLPVFILSMKYYMGRKSKYKDEKPYL